MSATPALKLTYYDFEARATNIRKVLNMGGIPFVDERLSRAEFLKLKPTLPYGMIPVLEVDGEVLGETQAILRYVGRLAGMYPPQETEALAAAMVDEMMDAFDDFFEHIMVPSFQEQDPEKQKQIRGELLKGPLPHAFGLLDKRLAQIQEHPYFQQDPARVTILDILAWDWVGYLNSGRVDPIPTTFVDDYKTIAAMYRKVEANPSINQREPVPSTTSPQSPPKTLKLTYFDARGRAEQIRLALRIGGIPFEDERLSFAAFPQRKPSFPNEQVPVLQIDDQYTLAQSVAILRYVGTFTGLYPVNDPVQALRIDEVLSHIGEFNYALAPSFKESDPEKKKQMRETLATTMIPDSLNALEKRLVQWKKQAVQSSSSSEYAMGGDSPTIADLGIHSLVELLKSGLLDHVPTSIVDKYPEILKASEAVKQHPRVQQWYAQSAV